MLMQRLVIFASLLSVAVVVDGFQPWRAPIGLLVQSRRGKPLGPTVVTRTLTHGLELESTKSHIMFVSKGDNDESGSSEGQSTRSITTLLTELGLSFKLRAEENISKSRKATTKTRRIVYALLSSAYFTMFLFYRAYRGFFVLLPAVFRRVYSKLETAVESDLSLEDSREIASSEQSTSWKTKITVSVLATVVTCSYVIGGAAQIVGKFFRTVGKTSSVSESFGAAAKVAVDHEDRIRRRLSLPEDDALSP